MHHFCTYFDQNYLPRGLALYESLRKHCPDFKLWILCMDQTACEILSKLKLPYIQPIPLEEFEKNDEELLRAKKTRSRIEYYFTCTPSLPLYIFKHYDDVNLITYLDADLFFFADPTPLFDELKSNSIAIIGHRFPARIRELEKYGIYNVGWLSFRRDETGMECLSWWRKLCLEWCYDHVEEERFADQKYLNRFPERFGHKIIMQHKGANVAPWNIENYHLHAVGTTVYVDEQPLIFFHFQGFKQITSCVYDWGLWPYDIRMSQTLLDNIYFPYIRTLQHPLLDKLSLKTIRNRKTRQNIFIKFKNTFEWCYMFLLGILKRRFALIFNGKVIW